MWNIVKLLTVVILMLTTLLYTLQRGRLLHSPLVQHIEERPIQPSEPMVFSDEYNTSGKPFGVSLMPYLARLQLTEKYINDTIAEEISSARVVFVTYSSSNHFAESRHMIRLLRMKSNNTIIYYDLGLKQSELAELTEVCGLIVRKFNYSSYPAHVQKLKNYAFKPIIIAETLLNYPFMWMLDTSLSFTNATTLQSLYDQINSGKFEDAFMRYVTWTKIITYTHPGMYKYLPLRRDIAEKQHQKGATIFLRKSKFSLTFTKWLLLCALTKDCIDPPGATVACGPGGINKGCHRYDQAAANIVLRSLLRRDNAPDTLSPFIQIKRDVVEGDKLKNIGFCHL